MRGKRAKAMRRHVYGPDGSHRVREYKMVNGPCRRRVFNRQTNEESLVIISGTIVDTGLRRRYQGLKALYRNWRERGMTLAGAAAGVVK